MIFHGALEGHPVTGRAGHWIGDVRAVDADVLMTFANTLYTGKPFFTVRPFGKGQACYCAADRVDMAAFAAILKFALRRAGVAPDDDLPPGVERQTRGNCVFYLNHSFQTVQIPVAPGMRAAAGGEPVGDRITLAGRSATSVTRPGRV